MGSFFTLCNIYITLWCIYFLQGTLYEVSGLFSQSIIVVLFCISGYCIYYINTHYTLPIYFKALNLLLAMFTVYGTWMIFSYDAVGGPLGSIGIRYLQNIYISLTPVYAFYLFTRQGALNEAKLRRYFILLLAVVTFSYFHAEQQLLKEAMILGFDKDEFTNNTGYTFVSLLPLLFFWRKRPVYQYLFLAYIICFVFMGMKRGAILIGTVCTIWFLWHTFSLAKGRTKLLILLLCGAIIVAGIYYINYLFETSDYFRLRYEETLAGNTSGRDQLYTKLTHYYLNDTTGLQFFFGSGANATLKVAGNYAHNDWIELAVNQGLFGIAIYLVYLFSLFKEIQRSKNLSNKNIVGALTMLSIIIVAKTIFSMSYTDLSIYASLCLGYCLANNHMAERNRAMHSAVN